MRLWHYDLIDVLPKKQLVSQWRETVAIKRKWEKGGNTHSLIKYVEKYDKSYLYSYTLLIARELEKRNIKYNKKYLDEFASWSDFIIVSSRYEEHNDRYLKQCIYNLQEKYDRGMISNKEWGCIENKFKYLL